VLRLEWTHNVERVRETGPERVRGWLKVYFWQTAETKISQNFRRCFWPKPKAESLCDFRPKPKPQIIFLIIYDTNKLCIHLFKVKVNPTNFYEFMIKSIFADNFHLLLYES